MPPHAVRTHSSSGRVGSAPLRPLRMSNGARGVRERSRRIWLSWWENMSMSLPGASHGADVAVEDGLQLGAPARGRSAGDPLGLLHGDPEILPFFDQKSGGGEAIESDVPGLTFLVFAEPEAQLVAEVGLVEPDFR